MDGVSLVPLLKGETIENRALFWHYPHYGNQGGEPSSIIMTGKWKLIHYHEDGRDELYDLSEDQGESTNLIKHELKRSRAMRRNLDAWLKESGAKFPSKDPKFELSKRKARWESIRTKGRESLERRHAEYLDQNYQPNKDWWGSSDD